MHSADPLVAATVPTAHASHSLEPAFEKKPSSHSSYPVFPLSSWKVPAAQTLQEDCPARSW